ncbi:MAG: alpha/beta hydrolase [Armatimonadetes bacterium]|nr:alpha/beta hydrolase [Armatimonadota bacterium]
MPNPTLPRIFLLLLMGLMVIPMTTSPAAESDLSKRRATLDQLRRILPPSAPWEAWLEKTGELPPDFDAMPSTPGLPDPLVRRVNGKIVPVRTKAEWKERQEELRALFQQWVIGSVPPTPDNLEAEVLSEREEGGATVRQVRLRFGPGQKATLRVELMIPKGNGPFPVFVTQHNHRGWALIALRRGYLGCVYAGADSQDDTDTFAAAYPDYDWSRLTRRGWAASRCVDYLLTEPKADPKRIALTGHSRNGKSSLIASALDDRFAAVISSSSGAGGTMPARYYAEPHSGEGIEMLTRSFPEWFHPRLRFFVGREDKLPVDMHELVALTAPRPLLLAIALNDGVESAWAMQQTYRAAKPVYEMLGAEENLRILWRPGGHETSPTVIERYLDWCDTHFGRGNYEFPERFVSPMGAPTGERAGRTENGPRLRPLEEAKSVGAWEERRAALRNVIDDMLGDAPPVAANPGGTYGREAAHVAALLGRGDPGAGVEKEQVVFGEYINADVYLPAGLKASGRKAPAVLWLHPFSYAGGYVAPYRRGEHVFRALARQGFVVLTFDQIGFGRRIEEGESFYRRHPRWSLLGKMVRDSRAALDAMERLPYVDSAQMWGAGYSLGSLVGLHLGALDDRLAGFVSVSGPPPLGDLRLANADLRMEGSRRPGGSAADPYSSSLRSDWEEQISVLLPRLAGSERDRPPYDLSDLLAGFAPRPVLVISPQLDWRAPSERVKAQVEEARKAYDLHNAAGKLEQQSPETYNQFGPEMQAQVIEWLKRQGDRPR